MINRRTVLGVTFLGFFLFSHNIYASDAYTEIVKSVKELCNAPPSNKSSFYKITAKGKVNLRIKIVGLAGADAIFNRKEWNGVQRVLQKDQLKDNEGYRKCTMTLTPIFITKFKNGVQIEKDREALNNQTYQNQQTYGNKSPIINNPTGPITIN